MGWVRNRRAYHIAAIAFAAIVGADIDAVIVTRAMQASTIVGLFIDEELVLAEIAVLSAAQYSSRTDTSADGDHHDNFDSLRIDDAVLINRENKHWPYFQEVRYDEDSSIYVLCIRCCCMVCHLPSVRGH
jgi:hypothetical protein